MHTWKFQQRATRWHISRLVIFFWVALNSAVSPEKEENRKKCMRFKNKKTRKKLLEVQLRKTFSEKMHPWSRCHDTYIFEGKIGSYLLP